MKAYNLLKDHVVFLCRPCTCLRMGMGRQRKQKRLARRTRDRNLSDRRGLQSEMETKLHVSFLLLLYRAFLISSKLLCQHMHTLLKHKMLKLTVKISLYMASTCFVPFGP
jgi:hypothetical protein